MASKIKTQSANERRRHGHLAAELPTVLWVLLFVLFFPLLNLGGVGLRTTLVSYACHQACIQAARARSFQSPIGNYLPAIDIAPETAKKTILKFSGIHLDAVKTQIVVTSIATHKVSHYSTPLPQPAQTADNTYQVQVTITAKVDPFIPCPFPADVPGVTAPMTVMMSDRQYFEATHNLHI